MYKLVAIDLDGTLLNSNGEITEETKQILQEFMKKDINVVLASGRMMDSMKTFVKEIGLNKYFIAGNGSIIYDIKKDEIIYKNFLSKEKVLNIIKICEENSIYYNIYTDKEILATALKYNVLYYNKENLNREEEDRTKIKIVENMYDYVQKLENENFLKMTICDGDRLIFNSIIRKIRQVKGVDVLDVGHMSRKIITQGSEQFEISYAYTEVSAQNVDKWEAIKFLLEKDKLTAQNVIAIGDNINDKMMIQNAGLGIAMKDSTPVVQEVADLVTEKSNNEDGVVDTLKKVIG